MFCRGVKLIFMWPAANNYNTIQYNKMLLSRTGKFIIMLYCGIKVLFCRSCHLIINKHTSIGKIYLVCDGIYHFKHNTF